jgi:hypothetical protein
MLHFVFQNLENKSVIKVEVEQEDVSEDWPVPVKWSDNYSNSLSNLNVAKFEVT